MTVLGFTIYTFVSFKRRSIELGVLRALGLSVGQMAVFLIAEQLTLIATGALAGTGLGVLVSNLCLGTMNFGWHTSEEDSFRIMDRALELGINFFDTADVYGGAIEHGLTEEIIVNLQGDAPLTPPWFLDALVEGLEGDSQAALATPILRCDGRALAALKADRRNGRAAMPVTAKRAFSCSGFQPVTETMG